MEHSSEVHMDAELVQASHAIIGTALRKVGNSEFSEETYAADLVSKITHLL